MDVVAAAFQAVPRVGFLPAQARPQAAHDGPIDIGHGQTNSQPRTVANMLTLLQVRRGQRVLDVGAGSGWTTALLAYLTGSTGQVCGVEAVPELVEVGQANLAATGQPWASITQSSEEVLGLPDEAPFERILVSAEARTLPEQLAAQLGDGGRMVIPVAGTMLVVVRRGSELDVSRHGSYRFVPLRSGQTETS
ncbi:MAG: Protein-L-isoaspartate O-methyltransferase [uncultured Nocardioidaceae bacterium]|uniref:Protein-L-isoaspartate O-methyltransferase n=1 Tax=uncultured Nocardioidaceae bacterium TaxID=253824 RepID=A0A6J4L3H2_9ACTN|nr:MAG: Protein-L-isoaspartate O-methyltransferase [uncultured Nocardioidaceae bacterium]